MEMKKAASLEAAVKAASCTYMAGGTDLMPLFKNGVRKDETIVLIGKLEELKGIREEGTVLSIGAAETLTDIAGSETVRTLFPALAEAAGKTASPQIRNIASLGGNVMQDRRCIYYNQSELWRSALDGCFKTGGSKCQQVPASPDCRAIYYSDTATALILYDAEAEYYENGELHTSSVSELISRHSRANGFSFRERLHILIVRFLLKKRPAEEKSGFYKYSLRSSIDFPLINYGIRFGSADAAPKIVAGAAGPEPVVLEESAALLKENSISNEEIAAACAAELKKKARIIKEDLISPARKREMFGLVLLLLEELRGKDGK
ncbi:MAG: FAD binding domain-containing protein [Lachnospiraceae bacterium]|nr:FAD binding domain-containing protein [Lachnospiraceae bacterium]